MIGDDSDYEEEESLVLVELSGIMETDLVSRVKDCKILGIDTEKPLLQLDNYIFQGEYEDTMGTCMLFEEKSLPDAAGFSDEPPKELDFQYLTNKKLSMQRVFIKKTVEEELDTSTGDDKTSEKMEVDSSSVHNPSQPSSSSVKDISQPGTRSVRSTSQPSTSSVSITSQPINTSISTSDMTKSGTISQTGVDIISSAFQTGSSSLSVYEVPQTDSYCISGPSETQTGSSSTSLTNVSHTEFQLRTVGDISSVTVEEASEMVTENSSLETNSDPNTVGLENTANLEVQNVRTNSVIETPGPPNR